jgi:carboxypeptidase C (cathepsin A)
MFGLFLENGPLRVSKKGSGDDDWVLGLAKEGSWLDLGDVVFID